MLDMLAFKLPKPETFKRTILASTLYLGPFLVSANANAQSLKNFSAEFNVQVASFNIGQGTHSFECINQNCTLKSSAKPSGFIRNFFKDELYETAELIQTDSELTWQSYQKKDIRYKGDKVSERIKTLKKTENAIVFVEKNQTFPLKQSVFDQMSIAYAIQWLRINKAPKSEFDKLILQTHKGQSKVSFSDFSKPTALGFDFANSTLKAEKFSLNTDKVKVELWCLADYNWFPAKIKIYNKDKDRTITLNLAKKPLIEP